MPNLWTPEAEDLKAVGTSGTMAGGGAKAIVHVTVSPSGGSWFDSMHRVLTSKQAEPHYLYDPATDRLGQYFALDRSSRSLRTGAGPVSCNKAGSSVIQIEFVANPDPAFTSYWRPGPNFRAMVRDITARGVAPRFPYRLATSYGDSAKVRLTSYSTYQAVSGWLGHCNVPGQNDTSVGEPPTLGHWDPGPINPTAFLAAASLPKPPTPAPRPRKDTKMLHLIKTADSPAVYLGDLITRRWVKDQQGLNDIRYLLKRDGYPDTIEVVENLDAFGTPVGPVPAP